MSPLVCAHACICLSSWSQLWFTTGNNLQLQISSYPNIFISTYLYVRISSCSKTHVRAPFVVNDFTNPNLVLDQNHFIAQVNTFYTSTIVTRAISFGLVALRMTVHGCCFPGSFAAGCVKTAYLLRTAKGGKRCADPSGS